MRKIIYINGPSFSGKSWIHNKLTNHLLDKKQKFCNVCFEQYFKSYNAELAFYDAIKEKASIGLVLAESVQFNQFNPEHSFNVICLPSLEAHKKNMQNCLDLFGIDYIHSRIFSYSVEKIRQFFKADYIYNKNYIVFNGHNLEEILKAVDIYGAK